MKYFNVIDIDERGEFRAHVEDEDGDILFEYDDEIFEDGYMKHKEDMKGLLDYLHELGFTIPDIIDNG